MAITHSVLSLSGFMSRDVSELLPTLPQLRCAFRFLEFLSDLLNFEMFMGSDAGGSSGSDQGSCSVMDEM